MVMATPGVTTACPSLTVPCSVAVDCARAAGATIVHIAATSVATTHTSILGGLICIPPEERNDGPRSLCPNCERGSSEFLASDLSRTTGAASRLPWHRAMHRFPERDERVFDALA